MHAHFVILLSGIVAGMILFQSAVIAPLLFKTLSIDQARPLLRAIFPKLFTINAVLGIGVVILAVMSDLPAIAVIAGVAITGLSLLCLYWVPKTNQAADENRQDRFKRLHTLSVLTTIVVLLISLFWILLL